jgi:protein-S-isoprenylcysteine O-methyltransferase Ste14
MTHSNTPAYGLWGLVIINSLVFIIFAFSFVHPQSRRDWRSFGAFSGFLVALFTEMYGFPLTIYLLLPWLSRQFPGVDFLSHDAGHLLETLAGWNIDPHFGPFHIASNLLIVLGFLLLAAAWDVLYRAQRTGTLAVAGPYSRVRHPQYVAFVVIMAGFLLQWPTLVTLVLFPILTVMYLRLARREEQDSIAAFGDAYRQYMKQVPAFLPRLGGAPRPSSIKRDERHG